MKNKLLKRVITGLMAVGMALSITACGGGSGDAGISKEDYAQKFTDLQTELQEVQSNAATIDPTDTEAAKKLIDDMKKPFADFIELTPPKEYAEAHEKIKSGCQGMVDYLDAMGSLIGETDAAKMQEVATEAGTKLQTAISDLTEGTTMLDEAK